MLMRRKAEEEGDAGDDEGGEGLKANDPHLVRFSSSFFFFFFWMLTLIS
jgi:hypothetical protein